MKLLLCIDFDNVFVADKVRAHEWMGPALDSILRTILSSEPSCDHLQIRLYGGWRDSEGNETNAASDVLRALGTIRLFPFVAAPESRIVRGTVDMAESLIASPGQILNGTVRRRRGFPRFRLADSSVPVGCASADNCPLVKLKRITQKPKATCFQERCNVKCNIAFTVLEQKLVDVMIACDVIQAAVGTDYGGVFILSNDVDLVPSMISARKMSTTPICLIYGSSWDHPYKEELSQVGVQTHRLTEGIT